MNQRLLDRITYIVMVIMALSIILMWSGNFPVLYSYVIIFFAAIILILRLGFRFFNLFNKKK